MNKWGVVRGRFAIYLVIDILQKGIILLENFFNLIEECWLGFGDMHDVRIFYY